MTEEQIPLSKRTRPATPRDPNYVRPEPTAPTPPQPNRGTSIFLLIIGVVLLVVSTSAVLFTTSLFLAIFFAAAMSIGGTCVTGALILSALSTVRR